MDTDTEVAEPVSGLALKRTGTDTVEGLAIPFGAANDRDLDGEFFTPKTDLGIDWFGKSGRPVLYDHGLDGSMQSVVIGRQTDYEARAEGIWAEAQLATAAKYRKAVDRLIDSGALAWSSGTMPHLAAKKRSGEILRWPWVELSATPIPAHPGTFVHYVKSTDALARFAEIDTEFPVAALKALAQWSDTRNDDPDALPDGAKFADLLDRLTVDGVPWVRARKDWFGKSGRVLSAATRERLMAHPTTLRQLADDLDELLAAADAPRDGKSVDLGSLLLESERTLARLVGVH